MGSEGDALLRERTRSYGVLNTLYHETRGEMELLNKQLCVKDSIIADLKSRLVRHERMYMTMGDDEPVVIGPSNSLVESLLSEICKLKQKRNDMEVKAARQGEVNPGQELRIYLNSWKKSLLLSVFINCIYLK